ncbi:MAG: hypothetical protein OXK17_05330 [Thaumarchaeota archaeon]|nr:hypothetical protein [Nitrososphaerota archaeon]
MNIPNLKKRIVILVIAAVSYIVPVWISLVSIFLPFGFFQFPYMFSLIRISVLLILVYGAFAWVRPSLVPPYLTKRVIVAMMCGIVIAAMLPYSALTLEPVGVCTVIVYAGDETATSVNGQSTEQNCFDRCLGAESARYNDVSCEFEGADRSWSETPQSLLGLKPAE